MDVEEIIIETLKIAEHIELDHDGPPKIYTCCISNKSVFSDVVRTGELCICAHSERVATLLFFLLHGIFDQVNLEHRTKWYTEELQQSIDLDYEDITAEIAMGLWIHRFQSAAEITEHNIVQPIIISVGASSRALTPSICDIWTLPRIRRQMD
jgi:hypothetical protein